MTRILWLLCKQHLPNYSTAAVATVKQEATSRTGFLDQQRGFGLVEMMIGMALGLLTILVVLQAFAVQEGYKRTSTGGADAQSSAALATSNLDRDLRNAGHGLNSNDPNGVLAVCSTGSVRAYNEDRVPPEFTFGPGMFAPVNIYAFNNPNFPAADSGTNIVQVNYGSGSLGSGGGTCATKPSASSANWQVCADTSRAGWRAGDMAVAVQPGKDCTITQVTELPGSNQCNAPNGGSDVIVTNAGKYRDSYSGCVQTNGKWNKPSGLGVEYDEGPPTARLFDLGPATGLVSNIYAVRSGRLTVCNMLAADCTAAGGGDNPAIWRRIVDDVVSLRAEYGLDTGNDGAVDTWSSTTPMNFAQWQQLLAVRFVVVTRSKQLERTAVTTAAPTWAGGSIDLSTLPDWQFYRYKTLEATVALKNQIWGRQP